MFSPPLESVSYLGNLGNLSNLVCAFSYLGQDVD